MDEETINGLIDGFEAAALYFAYFQTLMEKATRRLIVAGSAIEVRDGTA